MEKYTELSMDDKDILKELMDENVELRSTLEQVEWVGKQCPWCKGLKVYPGAGHSPSCKRQKVLKLNK